MLHELPILLTTAASLGFFHTLFGPDHYIPFIAMAQSGRWSIRKTLIVTVLCGVGHVLSSVVLGFLGVFLGIAVSKLVVIEGFRGNLAAWALIGFGLLYFIWGLRRAIRNRSHSHFHHHRHDESHTHDHQHHEEHLHVHEPAGQKNITPWVLFVIFILGPCEPLIPLLMYPAAHNSIMDVILVVLVFGGITIATMTAMVMATTFGINFLPRRGLERYMHALSGAAILLSGLAIQVLGL